MAQITDLIWQQLDDASGTPGLIFVDSSKGLCINIGCLTGTIEIYGDAMLKPGVVQALYKLRQYAAMAQATANQGKSIGERLAAFPPASNGVGVNGFVMSSGQIIVRSPISTTGIIGATN